MQAFQPCRDILGCCTVCLTDYTTTVERIDLRDVIREPQTVSTINIGGDKFIYSQLT